MATGARSTVVGASGGAVAASRGVVTSTRAPPSAMVAASSSIAAEATDGLHLAMETSESTHSMAATGDEAVAATILVDEAKEKGDKADHLTDGKESAIYTKGGDATIRGDASVPARGDEAPVGKGSVGPLGLGVPRPICLRPKTRRAAWAQYDPPLGFAREAFMRAPASRGICPEASPQAS